MRGCGEGVGAEQRERPHTYTHMVAVEVCVGWVGPGREVWHGKMYGSRAEVTLEDVETVSRHGLSLMVLDTPPLQHAPRVGLPTVDGTGDHSSLNRAPGNTEPVSFACSA